MNFIFEMLNALFGSVRILSGYSPATGPTVDEKRAIAWMIHIQCTRRRGRFLAFLCSHYPALSNIAVTYASTLGFDFNF